MITQWIERSWRLAAGLRDPIERLAHERHPTDTDNRGWCQTLRGDVVRCPFEGGLEDTHAGQGRVRDDGHGLLG